MTSQIRNSGQFSKTALEEKMRASCPEGVPHSTPWSISSRGMGKWIMASGGARDESGLLKVSVTLRDSGIEIEISTFYDVWAENDFFGRPHPEIYEQNAPRLAAGLQAVEDVMGAPATPGASTFFGAPYNYGVRVHKAADGTGIDVSDHL